MEETYPAEFNELEELHAKIVKLEEENSRLRARCISLEQIQKNPDLCQCWTGFPNCGTFKAFYDSLEEAARCKTNWRGQATVECRHYLEMCKSKPVATRKNSLEVEFFMTMVRLKAWLPLKDLSQRFGLSVASGSKICTTRINLMYFELKKLCQMPEWDTTVTAKHFLSFLFCELSLTALRSFVKNHPHCRQTRRFTAIVKVQ